MQRVKMPRPSFRESLFSEPIFVGATRIVRTCPACWRDFALTLDQDPQAVFFCSECSRPPSPGDELGVGD